MDYEELEKLNKEFAQESYQIMQDFNEVFMKWFKKSPRTAIVIMIQFPINVLGMSINKIPENFHSKCFPELPDMMYRFMNPFITIREKWGKIPDKEFMEEYSKIYQAQFDDWFPSEEEKDKFNKWFKAQKKYYNS